MRNVSWGHALILSLLLMFSAAATAGAQTTPVPSPTPPTTKLAFDHDGINVDGYHLYTDAAAVGVVIQAVAIATPAPHFESPFPALTPGVHTLQVKAFNIAGESIGSNILSVRLVVIPNGPTNLRLIVLNEAGTELLGIGSIDITG